MNLLHECNAVAAIYDIAI